MDKPVNEIAERLNATADQVLLAWVKAKGAVAVTYGIPPSSTGSQTCIPHVFLSVFLLSRSSSKRYRLEGYLAAADLGNSLTCSFPRLLTLFILLELTPADIAAIDSAGEKGARRGAFIKTVRGMAELMLLGAVIFRVYAFLAKT